MTQTKNLLRYVIFAGLFTIVFIPFLVPKSMFFPFITGKGFTFRFIVEFIFGAYVLLALIEPVYRPKFSKITKSILLFTSIIFLADVFGANPYKSLWSNYERMEGFVLIFHLVLYYLVLSSVLNTKDLWNKFLNTNIVAGVLMSFYGLAQLGGIFQINQGGVRVDGTLGNSTYLAIYLVFNIFLCLYMLVRHGLESWKKWVYGSVVLLQTVILYFTATRGAILGIIGGLVLTSILIFWKEKENLKLKKLSSFLLAGIVVFIVGFWVVKDTSFVKNNPVMSRFSSLNFSEFKNQGRYYVWPMALKGIADRPVLGWGQESFNFVFNKYYDPMMYGQEEWFDRTHNVVLDWLIAGGIFGFTAYVLIYVSLFYYIWRRDSLLTTSEKSVLTGMVVAYVFHNMFVFDNLISYIMFFTILAFVHHLNNSRVQIVNAEPAKTFSNDTLNYVFLPGITILTLASIYFVNVPALTANRTLIKAITPQEKGVEENLRLFKEAFSQNSFGSTEILEQFVTATIQVGGAGAGSNVTNVQKQAFYDLSKEKIEKKIAEVPNDARYLVFAGTFFNRFGQYDEAIKYLEQALLESPKKQSIHFELGSSYIGKGDFQKTFELFKKAYEYKPTLRESQILYAIGAIYAKNDVALKEVLVNLDENIIVTDNRFFNTYVNIGDYNSAMNILNARLSVDPKNKDTKLSLASLYVTMGQRQRAITTLREIIAEDPSFKEEGEFYINQLQS